MNVDVDQPRTNNETLGIDFLRVFLLLRGKAGRNSAVAGKQIANGITAGNWVNHAGVANPESGHVKIASSMKRGAESG
jgi:hypothetical protein